MKSKKNQPKEIKYFSLINNVVHLVIQYTFHVMCIFSCSKSMCLLTTLVSNIEIVPEPFTKSFWSSKLLKMVQAIEKNSEEVS